MTSDHDKARRAEAEDALRRVRRDSETIGASAFSRHDPVAPDTDDAVEMWGKRIGRGLGAIAVVVLIWQIGKLLLAPQ